MKSSWIRNGWRYWRLVTGDAEVVAVMPASYTPHAPPLYATFEMYAVRKGLAMHLGYAEGEHRARLHACFQNAFAAYEGVCS